MAAAESRGEPETSLRSGDDEKEMLSGVVSEEMELENKEGVDLMRHRVKSVSRDIMIRQVPSEGLSFQVWPASTTLLSILDDNNNNPITQSLKSHHHPLRILELGSGTGLVGIAAAAILGSDVTLTDLPHVIGNLDYNIKANSELVKARGGQVRAKELCWGNLHHMETVGRNYDLILASDVVYHDHLYEPLLNTLRWFILGQGEHREDEDEDEGGTGITFLMAHLKRWKKETAFFKKANKFFHVHVIHQDPPTHGKRVGVLVYRFAPKKPTGLGLDSDSASASYLGSPHPQVKENQVAL